MSEPKDPSAIITDLVEQGLAAAATQQEQDAPPPPSDADDAPPPDEWDGDGPPEPTELENVDWSMVEACAAEPETDIGNGRRFLKRNGESVLSVEGLGWAVHDGKRWALDYFNSCIRPLAQQTVEAIRFEGTLMKPRPDEEALIDEAAQAFLPLKALKKKGRARTLDDEQEMQRLEFIVRSGAAAQQAIKDRRAKRIRYGKTSSSTGKIDNMLIEAKPHRSRNVRHLDQEPLALNCNNGTLRFECEHGRYWEEKLHPHNKADLISKLCEVDYDPKALCPQFDKFVATILPDESVRSFVQRYFGYCLTAYTVEQVFVFFYGIGRNGKSTLVDVICRILGDYSTTVPFETLAGDDRRKASEATPDLVSVPGARLVRASEPESGMKFRESMVKSLTSSEPILIRRMREEFIQIYPTFKLVISGNHRPDIRGGDDGIWRRVLLVPFEVQIPKEEVDRMLPEKLWAERSGILNWLLEGARIYLEGGLQVPQTVRAATDSYREESDAFTAFLRGACEVTRSDDDEESPGKLYEAFRRFCAAQGFFAVSVSTFNKALPEKAQSLGVRKVKSHGMSVYRGLRVKPEFSSGPSGTPDEDGYGVGGHG